MKAVLKSDVDLLQIAVFAELALFEQRPELKRLLAAVPDGKPLDADQIDLVLPGLSTTASRNLLLHLCYRRLTKDDGTLTDLGRRCRDTGEAPVWELGAYFFLVARHPLFGFHLLDFRRGEDEEKNLDLKNLERVPSWFRPDRCAVWTSAIDKNRRFSIWSFPAAEGSFARCRVQELPPATLFWEIDPGTGENRWQVEGVVRDGDVDVRFQSPPKSIAPEKIRDLFPMWEPRWNRRTGRVETAYDGKARGGRETFLRTFRYPEVKTPFGTFRDVEVEDVPVGPADRAQATEWALALTMQRLQEEDQYWARLNWDREWRAVATGTPLEEQAGESLSTDSVVAVARPTIPARLRWLLQAPIDLAME